MAAAVVHLELHTGDLPRASDFYARLCGWQAERIDTAHGSYQRLRLARVLLGRIRLYTAGPASTLMRRCLQTVWNQDSQPFYSAQVNRTVF